jgi:hypothetical protein
MLQDEYFSHFDDAANFSRKRTHLVSSPMFLEPLDCVRPTGEEIKHYPAS